MINQQTARRNHIGDHGDMAVTHGAMSLEHHHRPQARRLSPIELAGGAGPPSPSVTAQSDTRLFPRKWDALHRIDGRGPEQSGRYEQGCNLDSPQSHPH